MPDKIISISKLTKIYTFSKRRGLKGFLRPERSQVLAVDKISLEINSGESVAFIGPNGAGKSTTIKMLCGILQPSSGSVRVLGLNPLAQRRQLAYNIGTVFGQRSQLLFNLPLIDSFSLTADMYGLDKNRAKKRTQEVIDQFDMGDFLYQPVRKLSLGQRMRAEIANSLLHEPRIIFLDEPTIGLDVVSKRALRQTIRQANAQNGTTIFLTSHDVGDIEEVCSRTIIVNHGRIMLDAPTENLRQNYLDKKLVRVVPKHKARFLAEVMGIKPVKSKTGEISFAVDTASCQLSDFLAELLKAVEVSDIIIEDTPLEDVIHDLYLRHAA